MQVVILCVKSTRLSRLDMPYQGPYLLFELHKNCSQLMVTISINQSNN